MELMAYYMSFLLFFPLCAALVFVDDYGTAWSYGDGRIRNRTYAIE